jgi:hypothetical protein
VCVTGSHGGPNERRLLQDLGLNDTNIYNKLERPVVNESDALTVQFGLVLQQIIGVVSISTYGCWNVSFEESRRLETVPRPRGDAWVN